MEYLDLYDSNKNKLNKKIVRGNYTFKDNEHILISVIFIENNNNEFLIQLTSKNKGSIYSSTGGHVTSGSNELDTIVKELYEELGLVIDKKEITFIKDITINVPIFSLYYLKKDIDLNNIILEKDEVEDVSYLTKEEILKLIDTNKFLTSHGILFKRLLEYKNNE